MEGSELNTNAPFHNRSLRNFFFSIQMICTVVPTHTYRLSGVCQSDKNGVGAGVEVPYQGGWLDRGSITSGTACQNNA